jgi:acetylornithine deacetylase
VEPADTPADHPGVLNMAECARKHITNIQVSGAPFPCDLFAFQKYGNTPGVIFGPVGGNLHGPDEWVEIESLKKVTLSLMDFIRTWCG